MTAKKASKKSGGKVLSPSKKGEQTAMTLGDLKPDPKNARRHTPRNVGVIVDALQKVGAARSIVIDEDNVILAGNATVDAAGEAGIERVQVVEADGNTLVAVRRTGLSKKQKAALAIADNRAADLAEWDVDNLTGLAADVELDLSEVGFTPEELESLGVDLGEPEEPPSPGEAMGDEKWMVVVTCRDEADQVAFLEQMQKDGRACRALVG